ncbi:GntR family transcriptional regulator [Endozoicomonas sp. OPT23]|uniref:GntR family transcriptional regulator n=1 Tax=Endozoicomonas sp. OPT23 TaxID=2072845 RepID=UPI00129A53CA|nr:GntR family transcriptional regulator [Endozoicomonas sp. OPT23]MRI34371.1 GntR family transcriptional regulator [Endozoicomonas sp. OPT23]
MKIGTQAQEVADILIRDITSGDLPEGSRVSEPELSRRYGIGRGPLREAILRLEGMGLVVRAPHVGARVVTLSQSELVEIFAVREALEGMAARLAAKNMSDHELQELEALLDSHATYIKENKGQVYFDQQGDYDFHYRIIKGSHNQRLVRSLCDELYHLIQMYRKSSESSKRPEQALFEHQMILKALKDRDADLAEMLMRRHIGKARREIEQFIEASSA